jgi:hypothetical protein
MAPFNFLEEAVVTVSACGCLDIMLRELFIINKADSFRATTFIDLLTEGVPLDDGQHLAGHADARTTKLYDRRDKKVTRNIVERISV